MTTEATKKPRNTTGNISAFDAAKRIARILGASSAELADIEKTVRGALAKARKERQETIDSLMARVPSGERDKVAGMLMAFGSELSGFEIQGANDTTKTTTVVDKDAGRKGGK